MFMIKRYSNISAKKSLLFALAFSGIIGITTTKAEEGMWTYDNPPAKQLKANYNFELSQDWLDHVRLSSVRFQDGGSGSFISPNGLVITNHHVAVGQIQKLSSEGKDLVTSGYYAADQNGELKCKDLELNVLVEMENVTDKIRAAGEGKSGKDAVDARNYEASKLEQKVNDKKGMKGEIVSLYNGGEYWLYKYKKYDDVRLVFAPERQAAYFGGDYDNFCFPRWDLDITIFRVYENGKPIDSKNYLKWNDSQLKENDLVFISGHPGSTQRLMTYSQLVSAKNFDMPLRLKTIQNRMATLKEYSKLGVEQERRALIEIFGLSNSLKARTGILEGLQDPTLLDKKKKEDDELRAKINADPKLKEKYASAWGEIEELTKQSVELKKKMAYHSLGSSLLNKALAIVNLVEESQKPDKERLAGYHESEIEGLKFRILSPAPIYVDLERASFIGAMNFAIENVGEDDPFVKAVLQGKKPKQRAEELFSGVRLDNVDYRKELIEGGDKAIKKSLDPMILLARQIKRILIEESKQHEELIESKLIAAEEKVADARFAVYGKDSYPDATFTLRLTYGAVKGGYPMNGTIAPYKTTLYGLFDRSLSFPGMEDFALPERYWKVKDQLDLSKTVNFVSTCDIIGGNSGSPTINKNAEFVGIVFDGNIGSLPGNFIYDISKNRAVSCSAEYISYALKNIYGATRIIEEIEKAKKKKE
jgi:hypothetical protein